MSPRTLRTITLLVALAGCIAQTSCSNRIVEPAKPPASPPPQQVSNIPPDSWFAGPDPNDASAGWQTDTGPFGGRYLPNLPAPVPGEDEPGIPHTMLSPESLRVFPKDRPERKTFFEVYGDRIWLRQEGDTVHFNAWVILPSGGSDPDSPYSVLVNVTLMPYGLGGMPVLTPSGPNGSPIGFRLRVKLKDRLGHVDQPSESLTYPRFDPTSEFHNPVINGYYPALGAGRAYAVASALDGDGAADRSVDQQPGGAVGIADRVDAGGGSVEDQALRRKILTFYIDHPPRLVQENASFRPVAQQVFTSRTLDLDLIAVDDDPLDASSLIKGDAHVYSHVGGPKGAPILRRRVAILGRLAGDPTRDTCYVVPGDFMNPLFPVTIPDWIANGPVTVLVRLCDCFSCDVGAGPGACPAFAGQELRPTFGTCVDTAIPCQLAAPGAAAIGVH